MDKISRFRQFAAAQAHPQYAYTRMVVVGSVAFHMVYFNAMGRSSATGVLATAVDGTDSGVIYPEEYKEYCAWKVDQAAAMADAEDMYKEHFDGLLAAQYA
jgi:pyruvoyl-dependent arginine decarboxylase (PvlArgDC)